MIARRGRSSFVWVLVLAFLLAGIGIFVYKSVSETRQYKRVVALSEAAPRLLRENASADEVRRTMGEPDEIETSHGRIYWSYDPGSYKGRRQRTYILVIDPTTQRVVDLDYIVYD